MAFCQVKEAVGKSGLALYYFPHEEVEDQTKSISGVQGSRASHGSSQDFDKAKELISTLGWAIDVDESAFVGHEGPEMQEVAATEVGLQIGKPTESRTLGGGSCLQINGLRLQCFCASVELLSCSAINPVD